MKQNFSALDRNCGRVSPESAVAGASPPSGDRCPGADALGSAFMKALVLSGGSGSRLRPITHTSAKQLLPVANKPVLFYGLEAIRDAGITEVGIVVGDTAPAIQEAVGDGSAFGLDATYIRQDAPLRAGARRPDRARLPRRRRFRHVPGGQLHRRRDHRAGRGVPVRPAGRPDHADPGAGPAPVRRRRTGRRGRGGRAGGKAPAAQERPGAGRRLHLHPAVHEAVRAAQPSWRGELEITEAIQWLIDNGRKVRSTTITGYWKDTGNVADMLEVNRMVLESMRARRSTATVDAATEIIGRVVVEHGAAGQRVPHRRPGHHRSRDAGVGLLHRPVHLGRAGLRYRRQRDRVLHRAARRVDPGGPAHRGVADRPRRGGDPAPKVPKAHRLVLGDHSKVQISS